MNQDNIPEVEEEIVGPGAITQGEVEPKPILEGASESEYVDVLNPLSATFVGQFGVTRPIRAEVTISPTIDGQKLTEAQAQQFYGVPRLSNPAKSGQAHISNEVRIPAGKTIRLLGSEAQVIVRQLVTAIMQREGKQLQLADKFARHQVEERVIISRGSIADIMGRRPETVSEQMRATIQEPTLEMPIMEEKPEKPEEVAFPDLKPEPAPEPPKQPEHILVEPKPRTSKKRGRPRTKTA